MKILARYVLREFLVPLFYCLTGLVSIYVLFELSGSFSRMVEAKFPAGQMALYFCGYLAPYFHYLAPAALMLATLYTMWMFCRHSEIVAMRASGVGFLAIAKPVVTVSAVFALFVAYVNEVFVPRHAQWAAQAKAERFETKRISRADNIVLRNAEGCRTWNVDSLGDFRGNVLNGVRVTVDRPGGARKATIAAERAEHLDEEWWFFGTSVQHHDAMGREIATPTPELDAVKTRCFCGFDEKPGDFLMQNRPWKFNSTLDRIRYLETHLGLTEEKKNDLRYDLWAQIVSPLACIIITLFAIPAGIASGRQSVFKGILGALAMYFAFYGTMIGCMIAAKNNWCNPVFAALLPDAVFLVLGVRAFVKQR